MGSIATQQLQLLQSTNKEEIKYVIVHTGILTNIMNNHNDAKSLELALMKMAKK